MVVRLILMAALLLPPGSSSADATASPLSPTATAVAETATAQAPSEPRFAGLEPYLPQANKPVEDFFVVSIISLPFTALWTVVGAAAVASISQKQFPPAFSNDAILSTAAIAIGASLTIGLLSVSWGKGHSSAAPTTP